jgi:phage-related protein
MVQDTPAQPRRMEMRFYQTMTGAVPVRDWLRGKEMGANAEEAAENRLRIGTDLKRIQEDWPNVFDNKKKFEKVADGVYEVKTDLLSNRISRVLVSVQGRELWALHGFIKKATQGIATPKREIDKARERLDDWKRRDAEAAAETSRKERRR